MYLVYWCLWIFVIVGWFLLGFVLVGIEFSSRLVLVKVGWSLQIIIKRISVFFSFNINILFHVLQLIYLISDCFLMIDSNVWKSKKNVLHLFTPTLNISVCSTKINCKAKYLYLLLIYGTYKKYKLIYIPPLILGIN